MFSDGGNGMISDAAEGLVAIERRQVGGGRSERGALRLEDSEEKQTGERITTTKGRWTNGCR